jgi:hypothetical protein
MCRPIRLVCPWVLAALSGMVLPISLTAAASLGHGVAARGRPAMSMESQTCHTFADQLSIDSPTAAWPVDPLQFHVMYVAEALLHKPPATPWFEASLPTTRLHKQPGQYWYV